MRVLSKHDQQNHELAVFMLAGHEQTSRKNEQGMVRCFPIHKSTLVDGHSVTGYVAQTGTRFGLRLPS